MKVIHTYTHCVCHNSVIYKPIARRILKGTIESLSRRCVINNVCLISQNVPHLVKYNLIMVTEQMGIKEEWRYATKGSGGQSVRTHGITTTLRWHADS